MVADFAVRTVVPWRSCGERHRYPVVWGGSMVSCLSVERDVELRYGIFER